MRRFQVANYGDPVTQTDVLPAKVAYDLVMLTPRGSNSQSAQSCLISVVYVVYYICCE